MLGLAVEDFKEVARRDDVERVVTLPAIFCDDVNCNDDVTSDDVNRVDMLVTSTVDTALVRCVVAVLTRSPVTWVVPLVVLELVDSVETRMTPPVVAIFDVVNF